MEVGDGWNWMEEVADGGVGETGVGVEVVIEVLVGSGRWSRG